MQFTPDFLYHIYNRGNDARKLFFNNNNYFFFLEKLRKHIIPFCDILAWCLMPNHFHLMVHVRTTHIKIQASKAESDRMTQSHPTTKYVKDGLQEWSDELKSSDHRQQDHRPTNNESPEIKSRTLNHSIGIMLRSYARAIQKQENITGSLFQPKTKAECINCHTGISPAWFQSSFGAIINTSIPEKQYPKLCFDYIHKNPVSAGVVKEMLDWDYSSARDYFGNRKGSLINRELASEWGLLE